MRRKQAVWVIGAAAAVLALGAVWAQQGPGGGRGGRGGRGGFGGMNPQVMEAMRASRLVETYWVNLAFVLKVEDAKLTALRPKFQTAFDARNAAFKKAREQQNFEVAAKDIKAAIDKLESGIKAAIGAEQMEKLKESARRRGPGGPGAGRPGGRPGGPGGRPGGQGGNRRPQ